MRRRTFLASGMAAASATLLKSGSALANVPGAFPTVLRLGLTNGSMSQTGMTAFAFQKLVAKQTNGRIRIDVYAANVAGGEVELSQDMAAGAIEMVISSTAGYASPGMAPQLGVFDIPFLFSDVKRARAFLEGPAGRAALDELLPVGIVGLAWGENGLRHVTTANKPVRSPKDLAGMKIRVPQSEVMMVAFKALGADPHPLPFPDLYAALAGGSFQAQENPLGNIKDGGLDQVQKYLCLTSHVYSAAMLMIGKRAFEALAPEDRDLLRRAAVQAVHAAREASDASLAADIEELRKRGMTVVDDVDRAAFLAEIAKAEGDFERMFGKQRLNAIRTFGS